MIKIKQPHNNLFFHPGNEKQPREVFIEFSFTYNDVICLYDKDVRQEFPSNPRTINNYLEKGRSLRWYFYKGVPTKDAANKVLQNIEPLLVQITKVYNIDHCNGDSKWRGYHSKESQDLHNQIQVIIDSCVDYEFIFERAKDL